MKKTIILFSMFIIGFFMFHPEITNATSNFSEIKTPQELHQKLKDEKLISLDENGLIIILDSLSSLGVNQDLAEDYTKKLNIINRQIQDGIISMDKELNVKRLPLKK